MQNMDCNCGNSKVTSKTPDYEYGQYYVTVECKECGWYWEGYYGICIEEDKEEE